MEQLAVFMERSIELIPHPQLIEALFAFKSRVASVFRDVLGLHEIHHVAVAQINKKQEILTFSSTPAMEFNLFSSQLWRFDRSYDPLWIASCTQTAWQSLYDPTRYDELYYLKQLKHHYPIGYSLAAKSEDAFFIYSFASKRSCGHTQELFANQYDDFYKIGQYCSNMLSSLFMDYNSLQRMSLEETQVDYETSN